MATPTTAVTLVAIGPAALLSKSAITIQTGQICQLQTTATDVNGTASGQKVNLSSNNLNVAKVTGQELGYAPSSVVAVGPGVAVITATASDNAAATATITVTVT